MGLAGAWVDPVLRQHRPDTERGRKRNVDVHASPAAKVMTPRRRLRSSTATSSKTVPRPDQEGSGRATGLSST